MRENSGDVDHPTKPVTTVLRDENRTKKEINEGEEGRKQQRKPGGCSPLTKLCSIPGKFTVLYVSRRAGAAFKVRTAIHDRFRGFGVKRNKTRRAVCRVSFSVFFLNATRSSSCRTSTIVLPSRSRRAFPGKTLLK